jgi:predicted amidophosphoribosyltransferase
MPSFASLLLPGRCPVCDRPGPAPCARCWAALRPAPLGSARPGARPEGLDGCRSLLRYDGAGRELVARLKYRNARGAVAWLAEGMARLVGAFLRRGPIDVVTWAPTSAARRRQRGFDQAELLARAVARRLGLPCRPLLVRLPGPPQTGRSAADRRRLGAVFRVRDGPGGVTAGLVGAHVLVVDDVVTSGATLSAAAMALRSAGATSVVAVTAGRTPLKVLDPSADP